MKTKLVKDLMVPLSEYATVRKDETLADAIVALRKAQEGFDKSKYRHRAILVFDNNGKVSGKVTMLSIMRALEPKYDEMLSDKKSMNLGFTKSFQKALLEQLRLWDDPLEVICQKASEIKVESFMTKCTEGEYIEAKEPVQEAIHQIVMGHHQSLLVIENNSIVGILRLTDVFDAVAESIVSCD